MGGALVGTEAERGDIGRDRRSHAAFLRDMENKCRKCWRKGDPERKCDDISLKWPGAAPPMLGALRRVLSRVLQTLGRALEVSGQAHGRPRRALTLRALID